jgi:hypothetical protein
MNTIRFDGERQQQFTVTNLAILNTYPWCRASMLWKLSRHP